MDPIGLDGLKELRKDLKKLDEGLAKEFREQFVAIAQRVASDARMRVPIGKTAMAAASIRGGVSGNNAYVAGGRRTVPYYGWLDFGSRNPVTGNPRSVGPWAKSGTGPRSGRFIYPAIADNHEEIMRAALEAFDQAADKVIQKSY